MVEHLWKAFELYLNRKDKFIKAEERLKIRLAFFEGINKLDEKNDSAVHEKKCSLESIYVIQSYDFKGAVHY